jgi:hypothetical protein
MVLSVEHIIPYDLSFSLIRSYKLKTQMHSSARIFDNGTLQAFYPEVVERYIEYNPDYEPIADINPEMFDDIPLPAKDIIFAAIRAPPGFSTQDSIDYIDSSTEVVFRFRNFADIEAVI